MDSDFEEDLSSFEFSQKLYDLILQMVGYTLSLPVLPRRIKLELN